MDRRREREGSFQCDRCVASKTLSFVDISFDRFLSHTHIQFSVRSLFMSISFPSSKASFFCYPHHPWSHHKSKLSISLLLSLDTPILLELDPTHKHTAKDLCYRLMERGLLAKQTHEHTIRFSPPLVITASQVNEGLGIIRSALADCD